MNKEIEKITQRIEKAEAQLRKAQQHKKILEHQAKKLTRKERTHRLCTRGAMLESYFPRPEAVTDEQVEVFFTRNELDMVYQYASDMKEETLAGLKEIVPVIHDKQTREIVENTIRKLEAIQEPECRRFIAATKQYFIEKRDNSIRHRLAEARTQSKAEKTEKNQKQPGQERP